MGLVHVLKALGVSDAELLAEGPEMPAHPGIAEALPKVLGEFILDVYFLIGILRGSSQPLDGYWARARRNADIFVAPGTRIGEW